MVQAIQFKNVEEALNFARSNDAKGLISRKDARLIRDAFFFAIENSHSQGQWAMAACGENHHRIARALKFLGNDPAAAKILDLKTLGKEGSRIARAMDPYEPLWQEELLSPLNVDTHVRLAQETKAPICTSERLITRYQFREYIERGGAEIVMPDLIWTGQTPRPAGP